MHITVIYPSDSHSAYKIAAEEFRALAEKVSGDTVTLLTDEEYTPDKNADLFVLIGNDAANPIVRDLYLAEKIAHLGIRYCTDDHCIRSVTVDGAHYLLLAGGRPRATIYAVYRYFEVFCGCRYFWDGDRIPKGALPLDGVDLVESPKFEYRGLRYFAHRSLHRFQAEHWSLDDWKQEIDWILKKRLNLFMLRIGMDDVFQRAFPDIVSYPERDEPLPGTGTGYDDRSLFWSLEYRGELRRQLLQYAFERDLLHPEDCGTMSHWYSRTPLEFLEKVNPTLLPQSNNLYSDPTGRVWDIRDKENFDRYIKLTEAHIEAYGKPEIFHTIGLGERMYSKDRKENQRMKLYVYRKIASRIKEKYPNAPLLIASWDLWLCFKPDEVKELVAELDPAQSIIFDYTSDTAKENNFTNWGVVNKFPWICGIFGGYEPCTEVRGLYDLMNERVKLAKEDPFCKGLVLWPEFSHADPFTIDYFTRNAWEKDTPDVAQHTDLYCADRYPEEIKAEMAALWRTFTPIASLIGWSVTPEYKTIGYDLFPTMLIRVGFKKDNTDFYRDAYLRILGQKEAAISVLTKLSQLPLSDELTRRDLYDIARTAIGRFINAAIYEVEYLYTSGASVEAIEKAAARGEALLEQLYLLLSSHEDYSLYESLLRLNSVTETNPNFEKTLKENASCKYCRSYIAENVEYLYLPEMRLVFDEVKNAVREGREISRETLNAGGKEISRIYFDTPLSEMRKENAPFPDVVTRSAEILRDF